MKMQQTLGCTVLGRVGLRRTLCAAILLATGASASAQSFTPGNLVVVRIGDGSATLGSTATATFLDELSPSGTVVRTLSLPTVVSGTARRLTNSGTATSEGALSLSPDGLYLGLAGYDAALGTASVTGSTSATINRIAARVDLATGVIDTTTALTDAQTGNNIRTAVWTSGGGSVYTGGGAGGARFATFGGTTSTQLSSTVTNLRVLNIFNGQLYTSSGSGTFLGVSSVGSGLPTTTGQTITLLSGFSGTQSSYDYFLASPTVLYVADDRATSGIQKWTFNGTTWNLAYTAVGGFRGLTGVVTGNNVQLYATSITTPANQLVSFTDTLAGGTAFSAATTLRTAATNTVLRGVRVVPGPTCTAAAITGQPASVSECASGTATFTTTATGTGPLGYQWRRDGSIVTDGAGISGTTTASVTLTGAGLLAGNYDVVVTNSCGTATSGAAALNVLTATAIGTQPASASVCEGSPATFVVAATGSGTLLYQWYKGAVLIEGATAASYTVPATSPATAGSYQVVVTGSCGSITSEVANLEALAGTNIVTAPSSQSTCAGGTVNFTAAAVGSGTLSYQWFKNGTTAIDGATTATLTINNASPTDVADYSITVTGSCGTATSTAAGLSLLAPTVIATSPAAATVCSGSPAAFIVSAAGTGALSYQWRKDGQPIAGATMATFTVPAAFAGDSGLYDVIVSGGCGTEVSASAQLNVDAITVITSQPAAQVVCSDTAASFAVTATGTGTLSYQWRKDAVAIVGATAATYSIASATAANDGSYDVIVAGSCGSVTSSAATLSVTPVTTISSQPAAQVVCSDTAASFAVTATGTGTLSYQWRKDAVAIVGATAATYSIASATAANNGSYDVIVAGSCGSVTSSAATLSVTPVTAISGQPAAQAACNGGTAIFSVVANGTGTLTYQWSKDGAPIIGATGPSLTVTNASATDAGSYQVSVTGACGASVLSNTALLTIDATTAITSQPVASTVCENAAVTLSVGATGTGTLSYQWRRDGQAIAGATSATLNIATLTAAETGSYDVVVTGSCGQATSNAATVGIGSAIGISSQPASITTSPTSTVMLSVTATGFGPLSFQWFRDGTIITNGAAGASIGGGTVSGASGTLPASGSDTATLIISDLTTSDAGSYTVVLTNPCGTVTSSTATIIVSVSCSLADIAGGGSSGLLPDGIVDGSDFVTFINSFGVGDVAVDSAADVAGGGDDALLPDGIIDGTDFIAFINAFAAGC